MYNSIEEQEALDYLETVKNKQEPFRPAKHLIIQSH